MAGKLAWMRGLASAEGREPRFGIRLHVITRDTEAEAWAVANTLLDHIDPAEVENAQKILGASEFILSGYPHLEEAYWFGEGVLPETAQARAVGAAGNRAGSSRRGRRA